MSTIANPVAAAKALASKIREAAPQTDRERRVPMDVINAMREAGLFHMAVPREIGGDEVDIVTASRAIEEVSFADGSTGWCVMIAQQNASLAGFLPVDEAKLVIGNRQIMAGTASPIGRAERVPGTDDFRITGRWPFASGSSHADWFGAECMLFDGDEPIKDDAGNQKSRMFALPRAEVTVLDNWDTTGLRGSASNDFTVDGAVAPFRRGFQMLVDPPQHDWPLYKAQALIFTTHGSQALGVARAAIDAAKEVAATKAAWGAEGTVSQQPRMQMAVGEAVVAVESARHYMYHCAQELLDAVTAGVEDTAMLRSRTMLSIAHAVRASVHAVDLVHAGIGTSSLFTGRAIERHFRDIHTAAAHIMVSPLVVESAGKVEMGIAPTFPFF